jgi:hypothetical protein
MCTTTWSRLVTGQQLFDPAMVPVAFCWASALLVVTRNSAIVMSIRMMPLLSSGARES